MLYRYNSRIDLTGDFEEDDDPTELKIENVLWLELYAIYNYLTPRTVKQILIIFNCLNSV